MEKIKSRRWKLYNFLMDKFNDPEFKNTYISKREIAEALPECYDVNDQSTRYLRPLETDIKALNASVDSNQHLIVSNSKGYKIATQEEFVEYYERRMRWLKNAYFQTKHMLDKARLNNQTRITFTDYEKDIVETFKEA